MTASSKQKLGDLFRNRRERGLPGLPVMSVTLTAGLVGRDTLDRKTDTNLDTEDHLLIKAGDIAYNMMRMWQGASGLAKHDGVVSPAYIVLAPKNGIDPVFASYWFKSPRMVYLFWAYSYGLTNDRLRLYFKDFAEIPVSAPSQDEQVRIGEILSLWDEAIAQTEKLIEAKRKLKKGLMQQLLTGKQRFKEFGPSARQGKLPEDWKRLVLGDIAQVIFSNVDKKTYFDETPVLLCNYLDVYNNRYISKHLNFMPATATGAEIHKFAIRAEDVLITKDSETPEDIANAATVLEDLLGVVCGYHLAILRPHAGVSGFYLGQLLMLPQIRYQFSKVANGVTRFGLNFSSVVEIPLWLPSYDEQVKIAKVLMEIDHQTETLLLLSNQFKKQKRGLMQQLLTGQIRVKAAEEMTA